MCQTEYGKELDKQCRQYDLLVAIYYSDLKEMDKLFSEGASANGYFYVNPNFHFQRKEYDGHDPVGFAIYNSDVCALEVLSKNGAIFEDIHLYKAQRVSENRSEKVSFIESKILEQATANMWLKEASKTSRRL